MDDKFHINSKGDAAPCKATKRACRFGDSDHFENIVEAVKESEKRLADQAGSSIKSHKKESAESKQAQKKNGSEDEFAGSKISRIKNVDNLINSKSRLEDFDKSVRFRNNATIEDVEITARNAAYELRNRSGWEPSIKVKTKDPDQTISFVYNRSDDTFEVKEFSEQTFTSKKMFSSKRQEDAMLYVADNYRYDG